MTAGVHAQDKPPAHGRNGPFASADPAGPALGRRVFQGGAINLIGQGAALFIQLFTMAVLARLLEPQDYGVWAMAGAALALCGLFNNVGLSTALVQLPRLYGETVRAAFFVALGLSMVPMVMAMAAAPLSAALFDTAQVAFIVGAGALLFPLSALSSVPSALLTRHMRFARLRAISLTALSVSSLVSILGALSGAGPYAFVAGAGAGAMVQAVLVFAAVPFRPGRVRRWAGVRRVLRVGLPLAGTGVITFFNRQMDNALVGWRWGAGDLGLYTRAYQILMLPQTLVAGPISGALVPGLSRLQDDPQRWRRLLLNALQLTLPLSFCVAAVMMANGAQVIAVLAGQGWDRAGTLVAIFGVSMLARAVMTANPWMFVSLGRTRAMLALQSITLPAYMGGILVGLPHGIEGVALGFSLVHGLLCVPSVWFAARGAPVRTAAILRLALPLALLAVAVAFLSPAVLAAMAPQALAGGGFSLSALGAIALTVALFAAGFSVLVACDPAWSLLRLYGRRAARRMLAVRAEGGLPAAVRGGRQWG